MAASLGHPGPGEGPAPPEHLQGGGITFAFGEGWSRFAQAPGLTTRSVCWKGCEEHSESPISALRSLTKHVGPEGKMPGTLNAISSQRFIRALRFLVRDLELMDANDRAKLFFGPRSEMRDEPRHHLRGDLTVADATLRRLRDEMIGVDADAPSSSNGRPLSECLTQLSASTPKITSVCKRVGMTDERSAPAIQSALRQVLSMLHARQRRLEGKPRVRALRVIQHNAKLLAPAFESSPEMSFPSGGRLQLSGLLEAVSSHAAEIASYSVRPRGRPSTPDAFVFGSEALLAIWNSYARRPVDLSRQPSRFLWFGEAVFNIAFSALGARPSGLSRTTVANSLRKVVEEYRVLCHTSAEMELATNP